MRLKKYPAQVAFEAAHPEAPAWVAECPACRARWAADPNWREQARQMMPGVERARRQREAHAAAGVLGPPPRHSTIPTPATRERLARFLNTRTQGATKI